jgi:hypothetical protein
MEEENSHENSNVATYIFEVLQGAIVEDQLPKILGGFSFFRYEAG